MIKILKLTVDNQPKEVAMDLNGMLKKFDDMFNQFAHQCVQKTSGYQGCTEDFDDFKQIARIKAMEKFESYDITKGANFSTILFTALRGLMVDIIRKNESQMRKCKQQLFFIDSPIGENGETASEIIADTKGDVYFEEEATDLEKYLASKLTKEEIMFYTVDLKKQIGKASSKHKLCLQHTVDCFTLMVGEIPDKKEDLATLLGLSRPTVNKRIKETVIKVKDLTLDFCLANNYLSEIDL